MGGGSLWAAEPEWNSTSVQTKISTTEISAGEFVNPTYYQIVPKNHASQCVDAASKNANGFLTLKATSTENSTQWVITGNATDGYKFVNKDTKENLLLKTDGLSGNESNNNLAINPAFKVGTADANNTDCFDIVDAVTDGYFVISVHDNNNYVWNDNNGALAGWYSAAGYGYYGWNKNASNASGDTGSMFQIQAVNFDNVNLTVNFKKDGSTIKSADLNLPANNENWLTFITLEDLAYYDLSSETSQLSSDDTEVDVNITPNFPFQEGKYYQIKNRNQNYVKNETSALSDKNGSNNYDPDQLWYFVAKDGTLNEFTIHCVANGLAWNGTTGTITLAEDGTAYQILKNGSYFNIFTGTANGYAGAHINYNGEANNAVGYWSGGNASEPGSQWTLTQFEETALISLYSPASVSTNAVGSADNYDTGHDAYTAYQSSKNAENLKNVLEAYNAVSIKEIEEGKYYTIRENVRATGNYMTANPNADKDGNNLDSNRGLYCENTSGSNYSAINRLWQFEATDGQYYIKNANSGLYIGQPTRGTQVQLPLDKQYAGTFAVQHYSLDNTKVGLKFNNEAMHLNTNNQLTRVDGWNEGTVENSNGHRWTVEEVTEIPVTVGAAGYSTFCSPVNVVIPGTVEAYVVKTASAESVTLTQVTGILPAGEGVILKNQGDHTFTITNDAADADVDGNLLTGTTIRRQGYAENAIYVLANKDNGVGLYLNGTVSAVPANKAYYVGTGNSVKSFSFDDAVADAIRALETEQIQNATIYDMSGRKVNKALKGIYIVNGKKVIR